MVDSPGSWLSVFMRLPCWFSNKRWRFTVVEDSGLVRCCSSGIPFTITTSLRWMMVSAFPCANIGVQQPTKTTSNKVNVRVNNM
ncbi:MAG: hypothetical protein BWY72_02153 [Bacteroidetes bacterium ADurb.Bin416]|nr:MAG: hypothetical protein BWY72_02153 [Bacteroidetes bacterium ADurb.Bin416]